MFKNEKTILLLIVAVALILRLVAIINLPPEYLLPYADAHQYHYFALSLLHGKGLVDATTGLPTSYRPPLYPLFLAFIYSIFSVNYFAARVVQAVMGALLCIPIFYIARRIFDKKTAMLSAVILAFYQPYIYYLYFGGPGFLLSENLYTFLFALFMYSLVSIILIKAAPRKAFFSGALLGLTALTRPEVVFFPALILALIFCCRNKYRPLLSLRYGLVFILGFILIIFPWALRNYFVHKAFVPLTSISGLVFWDGNNPDSRGSWGRREPFDEKNMVWFKNLPEVERDRLYFKAALKFLSENSKRIPKLYLKKLMVFWSLISENNKYNIWYGIILIFGLIGIQRAVFLKMNNMGVFLLLSVFLYFSVFSMVFQGQPRYRYIIEPYLIICCSWGICFIFDNLKNKILVFSLLLSVIGINIFFYVNSGRVIGFLRLLSRNTGLSW